jgi:GTP-binding protein
MSDLHINFRSAEFLISASRLKQCPDDSLAEIAFAGRSNAGKSSAINALTRNPRLARTSKTPGRTQLLNFFQLNVEGARLVDLPGYGYAKVPLAMQREWQKHLNEYLEKRQQLCGIVLVMDIRHPMREFDRMIVDWCLASSLPLHMLLTKADKVNRNATTNALRDVRKGLPKHPEGQITIQAFSSSKGTGLPELERQLVTLMKPHLTEDEELAAGLDAAVEAESGTDS